MAEDGPKFRRERPEIRREALIAATLELVAESGVRGATVREIAKRANVTQGMIRHLFSSKDDLVAAAYALHMETMTNNTVAQSAPEGKTAREKLVSFINAALMPPVVDPKSVSLWASFLNKVREDAHMRAIHEQTYRAFRDRLEALIHSALKEADITTSENDVRRYAIAANAVIDGLWLEGGALPEAFAVNELPSIGVASVGAIIGLPLGEGRK